MSVKPPFNPQTTCASPSLLRYYYSQITLTAAGSRKSHVSTRARAFLQEHCADAASHKQIQQRLMQLLVQGTEEERSIAEICLRCYISHQIVQVCVDLVGRFGARGGFQLTDLLPIVLDDAPIEPGSEVRFQGATACPIGAGRYTAFAHTVLKTFDPSRNTCLSTWTKRKVTYHKELNAFLQECGVYLISDWGLLNSATVGQLRRILTTRYTLTDCEIQQACYLLESYHAVYSAALRQRRQQGYTGKCPAPASEQLQEIAQHLQKTTGQRYFPLQVLSQLSSLAQKLRQRQLITESLEAVDVPSPAPDEAEQLQAAFLLKYRQKLVALLDRAIAQTVDARIQSLQARRGQRDRQFLQALHLFYVQGRSMGEIAPLIGVSGQPQVSRLLKLNELRAHVRQQLLDRLKTQVQNLIQEYIEESGRNQLCPQLDTVLAQETEALMNTDAAEVSTADRISQSLLSQRIRCYLDQAFAASVAA